MGHTWREMDPAGAEAQDRHIGRLLELRIKLENMSLSEFTAGELKSLYRVMGVGHSSLDDSNDEDMTRLERKLQRLGK